nr:DNA cytosine methyltransferase [uncultured Anaerobutyricum sp.]
MYKTIDLFAGAGGLSYGFEMTGEFFVVAAAENNKYAQDTYLAQIRYLERKHH